MASRRSDAHLRRGMRGFTLIEAVVALLIVALGMMAVYTQLNQYVRTSIYIEEKTLASWIATNRLTELSVQSTWPALGDQEEELDYAGRPWVLSIEVSETDVPNLRRADVAVSLADDRERVVHAVSALVEPPPPRGFVPLRWLAVPSEGGPREQGEPGSGGAESSREEPVSPEAGPGPEPEEQG